MAHLQQKLEQRQVMVAQMQQSLRILTLPLLEMKAFIAQELETNPFLEEQLPEKVVPKPETVSLSDYSYARSNQQPDSAQETDLIQELIAQKVSLQDVLMRQLAMFARDDDDICIGQEIIGNIDDNGYLRIGLEDISRKLGKPAARVEEALRLIQKFDPAGIAARSPAECLIIQLELSGETDPLIKQIIENHLQELATKNYSRIARTVNRSVEEIVPLIRKIQQLNPKPGRNYCADAAHRIIPDAIILDKGDEFEITVNNEDIPMLNINKAYRKLLKDKNLDPQTRHFLTEKLSSALELLRAISKRKFTLRRIIEVIADIQQDAIRQDFSLLKPLTFQEVAGKLDIHESTVCRAIMNKYIRLPFGVVSLKDFFASCLQDSNGHSVSSTRIKSLVAEIIDEEDKKKPQSDQDIVNLLAQRHQLKVSRRTVTKYREEMKILSSPYRKIR